MTSKIATSNFKKEWSGPKGTIYYHDLTFEGDSRVYNIGAQQQSPSFLAVGQSIDWEWKDESKGSIKRMKPAFNAGGGGKPFDQVGVTVGAGLNQAVMLVSNGKADLKDIEKVAHRLIEIAFKLKDEFTGR